MLKSKSKKIFSDFYQVGSEVIKLTCCDPVVLVFHNENKVKFIQNKVQVESPLQIDKLSYF